MYAAVEEHPSVRELYAKALVKAGAISQKKADAGAQTTARDLAERQAAVRKQHAEPQLDRGAGFGGDRGSGRAGDRGRRRRPCGA